ncbi:Arylsulfatase [Planctomycetes bacterium CA13]|uniref:Arylsulfatase n=1 Tax=Novipirellula herctigrandis TaxID=2527986 RepID=A0A5C5YZ60_9BACT|nr:Arylsulfatase [Planctomycetes bacterium CA13]
MSRISITSVALLLSLGASLSVAERPNIIVILTDDMGYSDMGCFGGEIETPNLDSLAADGLRFTEFYNCARCWPTRSALLSGCYIEWLKTPKHVTIPQILKTAGYDTAMSGKWHAGGKAEGPAGPNSPAQRGFDDFYGTLSGAGSHFDPHTLTRNTEEIVADEGFYYTDQIGTEAVRQIEGFAKTDRPFFQYVAFTTPHWPMHAPEETIQNYVIRYGNGWVHLRDERYARMLEMGVIDRKRFPLPPMEPGVPAWEDVEHKPWRVRQMAIYAAMVDHMDQAVGRMVKALKRTGQFKNTLIVYFHDNGACAEIPHAGAASYIQGKAKLRGETVAVGNDFSAKMGGPLTFSAVGPNWANAQNTPMRRYKKNVHNGGALTPAIMHWPAGLKAKAGSISTQRGHVIDMMATCLELAGVDYPTKLNSHAIAPHNSLSLVPVLEGETVNRDHAYFFRHAGTSAVVKGDYKIVREGKQDWELYNLSENRTETEDIAAQHPELVQEMSVLWDAHWRKK